MKLEHYELEADRNFTTFEFVSEGKNGRVVKEVRFQPVRLPGVYNLVLGDKDPVTGHIDDLAVTNNGDTEKTLATVVAAVLRFTEKHPEVWIHAIGSTKARTRLYRMLITKYFEIAMQHFRIIGKYQNQWESFEKNKNYKAYAAQRKKR